MSKKKDLSDQIKSQIMLKIYIMVNNDVHAVL